MKKLSCVQVPEAFQFLYEEGDIRYRVAFGGRGSGKSWAFAQALLIRALVKPMRILCAREVQHSIRDSVKLLLDDTISRLGLHEHYQSFEKEIYGANGSLFAFTGLRNNADIVRSKEGFDLCWVEEASTVSQRSLNTLIPTIRKPGSELWFTFNPRYDDDPVDAMFRNGEPPPGTRMAHVNFDDNPFFPAVLLRDLEWDRSRDPDKYAHVWLGEYLTNSEARVFRNWRVGVMDIPDDARPLFGADWGFSIDPTVLVRCWLINEKTLYIDREAYAVNCDIDATPALFERAADARTPKIQKWPIRADSARPETISYMKNRGWNITGAEKGPGSVEDGVSFLQSVNVIINPECRHTIDEWTLYSYKIDKHTEEVLPILEDKHNHVVDACRYALEATRKGMAIHISDEMLLRSRMRVY